MGWIRALAALAVVIVAAFVIWLRGCDEVVDCGGVSLVAYYALLPLIGLWLALLAVAVIRWRGQGSVRTHLRTILIAAAGVLLLVVFVLLLNVLSTGH